MGEGKSMTLRTRVLFYTSCMALEKSLSLSELRFLHLSSLKRCPLNGDTQHGPWLCDHPQVCSLPEAQGPQSGRLPLRCLVAPAMLAAVWAAVPRWAPEPWLPRQPHSFRQAWYVGKSVVLSESVLVFKSET